MLRQAGKRKLIHVLMRLRGFKSRKPERVHVYRRLLERAVRSNGPVTADE